MKTNSEMTSEELESWLAFTEWIQDPEADPELYEHDATGGWRRSRRDDELFEKWRAGLLPVVVLDWTSFAANERRLAIVIADLLVADLLQHPPGSV